MNALKQELNDINNLIATKEHEYCLLYSRAKGKKDKKTEALYQVIKSLYDKRFSIRQEIKLKNMLVLAKENDTTCVINGKFSTGRRDWFAFASKMMRKSYLLNTARV